MNDLTEITLVARLGQYALEQALDRLRPQSAITGQPRPGQEPGPMSPAQGLLERPGYARSELGERLEHGDEESHPGQLTAFFRK